MATRPRSKVTEKQELFIEAKVHGLNDLQAALAAGASSGHAMMNSATVREQLAAARRWLTDTTQITRLDVIEGVIDGIEMARMQGDSANVIKGWCEVGKILGHYAPEVKRIELSTDHARMRSKFESLSDAELLTIAEGTTVDGTCTTIN